MHANATATIAHSRTIDPPTKTHTRVFEIARAMATLTAIPVITPGRPPHLRHGYGEVSP